MSKINVYSLKRPKKERKSFIIKDPNNPGVEVHFTILEPNMTRALNIEKIQNDAYQQYIVPNKDGERMGLMPIDGEVIDMTEELISIASAMYGLQPDDLGDSKYSLEEIIVLIHTMEEGMICLLSEVKALMARFQDLLENPTQAVITPLLPSSQEPITDTLN